MSIGLTPERTDTRRNAHEMLVFDFVSVGCILILLFPLTLLFLALALSLLLQSTTLSLSSALASDFFFVLCLLLSHPCSIAKLFSN
jgi:hypothetical protein